MSRRPEPTPSERTRRPARRRTARAATCPAERTAGGDPELAQASERFLAIARITTPRVGSRPLRDQAGELLRQVCHSFKVEAGILRVLEDQDLALVAAHGIPPEQAAPRMPSSMGIAARVLAQGTPYAIADVGRHSRTRDLARKARDDPSKFKFMSYAGAPLVLEGHTVGILAIFSTSARRTFTDLELRQLQILANHIAICIANEHLYQTLAGKQQELQGEIRRRDEMQREHARLEEQLRHVQKMEALGHLAGGVAHDFNNTLTVILGNTAILLERLRSTSAPQYLLSSLLQIQQAGQQASELTRRLLAFSRRQPTNMVVLDMARLVQGTKEMLSRLVRADVTFQVDCGTEELPVRADASQIQQVLLNLLLNACDAIPDAGCIEIWCRPLGPDDRPKFLPPSGRWCVLGVRDTGVGMTAETQAHIFEPFFTTKPIGHGTGLGLSMVYGIVTQAGGRIEVQSEPGKGSTFRIYLPCCDEPVAKTQPPPGPGGAGRGKAFLLLCEDDDAVRSMLVAFLANSGFEVLEASDGESALELAATQSRPLDLLITDIVMPGMRGQELARRLAGRQPDLRVLFISGYLGEDGTLVGVPEDAMILPKPFMPRDLLNKVQEALAARPGRSCPAQT